MGSLVALFSNQSLSWDIFPDIFLRYSSSPAKLYNKKHR